MIVHIVLFKLKERTPEGVEAAKAKLLSMEGKVEMRVRRNPPVA